MAIVYRHRRLDTNEIFYIGLGSRKKRAFEKSGRNNMWNKIIAKTQYVVEIIADNIPLDDAQELEMFLISLYGRKDLGTGGLANLTDGGENNSNHSKEGNKRISQAISLRNKTLKRTEEWNKNIADANRGKKRSKEFIEKTKDRFKNNGYSKEVLAYNYYTGDFLGVYYSISEATRALNLPIKLSSKVSQVCNRKRNQVKGFTFKFTEIDIEKPIKKIEKRNPIRGKEVLCLETGIFYDSGREAYDASGLNITKDSFNRKLNGKRINDTNYIFI